MSLGEKIRRMRYERGETLGEFGKHFDPKAADSIVSRWERDISKPTAMRMIRLAELGNTTVDELLYHESKEVRQLRAHKAFATDLQRVSNEFDLRQRNANSVVRELKDLLNSLDETVKEIGGDA